MELRLNEEMIAALRETPELPDNLRACIDDAHAESDAFVVTVDDDEQMALTELCEWYVRKDPETDELTKQGRIFDANVQLIIDADLAQ